MSRSIFSWVCGGLIANGEMISRLADCDVFLRLRQLRGQLLEALVAVGVELGDPAGHDQADDGGAASRGRQGPFPRWTSDLSRFRIIDQRFDPLPALEPGASDGPGEWRRAGRSPST